MDRLFFELMQVGTGQLDCLSRAPSAEEWQELHTLAQREKVAGVCYHALVHLIDFGLRAPQELILDWMAEAEDQREKSVKIARRSRSLQKKLDERGFRSALLPGQGILQYYDEDIAELRHSESIDIFVRGGKERAEKFVKLTGQDHIRDNGWLLYLESWSDTEVRILYRFKVGKSSGKTKKLDRYLRQNVTSLFCKDGDSTVPSPSMNIVLTLVMLYNRLLSGSLTMRELMDLYFILRQANGGFDAFSDGQTVMSVMKSLRLFRFSQGVMWLMQEVFGLEPEHLPIASLEHEGHFLLNEVMQRYPFFKRWSHLLLHYRWADIL